MVKIIKNRITVVFSTHFDEAFIEKFKREIKNTIGVKHEIISYENKNKYSLSQIYNNALNIYTKSDNIFVFIHHDIVFKTKNWGKKLLNLFNNFDYGIIGVAGTTFLSENGIWWDDLSKAYGIVDHTDNIKNWTTMFSKPINNIQPVVTIDGVFMGINPDKIKHKFDEDFGNFHFYDLGKCLNEYLDGVNIGVTTDIRILHKSVGRTNKEWEENRIKFINKYSKYLPIKHVSENKLRILISCYSFSKLTGSELANFELAKELVKLNCCVTLIAYNVSDYMLKKATHVGIKVYDLAHAPNYKIIKDNEYNFVINETEFDIIHINHKPIANIILQLYPNTPSVMQIHSEVIPILEEPIMHPAIKKYLSIRDSISEYIKTFGISDENIIPVDNPFDFNKFNTNYIFKKNEKPVVLFVGTIDYLRIKALEDLSKETIKNNQILWIVGRDVDNRLVDIKKQANVMYFGETDKIEEYTKSCDITAGIFKGRTTIEGWLCGKPAIIYHVDKNGCILNKEFAPVPNDLERYKGENVAKIMLEIYNNILDYE